MQTATAPFVPPPPQNGYQPLSEAEIYTIKSQYLGLLPQQQIIDICLTFEAHAPLQIKSSVWPYDIRAAIASIRAQKAQSSQTQTSPESDATSKATSVPEGSSGEDTTQPQPSPSQQPVLVSTQAGPSTSAPSVPQPAAPQSQISPSHYPHQPYYHPTYPHVPYYTPPHAAYSYPNPYPSFPQPPAPYPVNPAGHHLPLFTSTPPGHPPHPGSEAPPPLDDLPSYEEMIVEALLDSGDPEGCAPKSLFSWMAMHYPIQTNFRPSASQALQKAYKRGRLEKGSNGKYRLNENWEGGNTSRRTTRRPQTLAQTAIPGPPPPSSSPFTHVPLVTHGPSNLSTRLPPPGQPPGYGPYPYGHLYQGAPGPAPAIFSGDGPKTASQKQAADGIDHEAGEGSDVWEAAQNILKAINFGQLIQLSSEENMAGEPPSTGSLDQQEASGTADHTSSAASAMVLDEPKSGARRDGIRRSTDLDAEQRAALQAQLALLAAQLAELADVSEDELSHNLGALQGTASTSNASTPQVPGEGSMGDDSDDGDNDMVEVQVPMASLTA